MAILFMFRPRGPPIPRDSEVTERVFRVAAFQTYIKLAFLRQTIIYDGPSDRKSCAATIYK